MKKFPGNVLALEQKVREIIGIQLDCEISRMKDADQLTYDLGADDLAHVEVVLALEEQFEFDIPDEDWKQDFTVRNVINYITSRVECAS